MSYFTNSWAEILKQETSEQYFQILQRFIERERKQYNIYPKQEDVFNAFNLTDYHSVKIVILGQDPYHGPNQAHGLSFSVPDGIKLPPSLVNIYKELESDLGIKNSTGCLEVWAKRGIFLLNTTMTVREGQPGSHVGRGWEKFTDVCIDKLAQRKEPIVFILWGANARQKSNIINRHKQHLVLESNHPSPLSAYKGFFGSKPFSKCNNFLGINAIDFKI